MIEREKIAYNIFYMNNKALNTALIYLSILSFPQSSQ